MMSGKPWSIFDPIRWTHAPDREHPETAKGREALNALWEQESKDYVERPRVPEAVCRGYHNRAPSHAVNEPIDIPLAPGDEMPATRAWLAYVFANEPLLAAVLTTDQAKLGCSRLVWRAGVGALIRRPRGQIEHPASYLTHLVRQIAAQRIKDPRGDVGYFASDTWPLSLILFAQVNVPHRYQGQ